MINGHLSLNNLDPQHAAQHRILFQNALGIIEKLATAAPTVTTLPDGYVQFALISSKLYLYLNKNGTIYSQEFGVSSGGGDHNLNDHVSPDGSVEFNQKQALQLVIENRTSDPGSPVTGQIWYRTDL